MVFDSTAFSTRPGSLHLLVSQQSFTERLLCTQLGTPNPSAQSSCWTGFWEGLIKESEAGLKKMGSVDVYVCYRSVYSLAGKSLGFAIDRGPFITSWSAFGLLVPGATLNLICRVVRIQPGAVRKRRRRRRWRLLPG